VVPRDGDADILHRTQQSVTSHGLDQRAKMEEVGQKVVCQRGSDVRQSIIRWGRSCSRWLPGTV